MALTLDDAVTLSDDAVFRELDGEAVVLNLETGMYYGLDAVGTVIWRAVESSGTLRHALDRVLDQFTAGADAVILHGATPDELVPVVDAYRQLRPAGRFDALAANPGISPVFVGS